MTTESPDIQPAKTSVMTPPKMASELPQNPRPYILAGWAIVLLGVVTFFVWSALVPLDKGVAVSGTVIVEGRTKTVHHLNGGQIETILVHDGQSVEAGQLLISMNDTQARASVESLKLQLDNANALLARLQAENAEADHIEFSESLKQRPQAADIVAAQTRLFETRRKLLNSRLSSMTELIAGYGSQLQGLKESKVSREIQRKALGEQLQGMYELEQKGYVARNNILETERLHEQINGAISQDIGNIGQLQRQLQELKLRKQYQQEEFMREVHDLLAETELKVLDLKQQLQAAEYQLENTRIIAPVSGTVVNLSVFTEGGFIDPGAHQLDIVPASKRLHVEAQGPST